MPRSQGEVTSILMAYFSSTKRINFPFVSKEDHFEGTHHYVVSGTIKTLWGFRRENTGFKVICSMLSKFIPLKLYSVLECHFCFLFP